MASTVAQSAFGLQLSRKLSALIHQGINDAGPALSLGDIATPLRNQIGGQTVGSLDYNADPSADSSCGRAPTRDMTTSRREACSAHWAKRNSVPHCGKSKRTTACFKSPNGTLRRCKSSRASWLKLNFSPQRERALRAAESALIAQRTVKFLRSWPMGAVNTRRLRSALTYLRVSERRLLPNHCSPPMWKP